MSSHAHDRHKPEGATRARATARDARVGDEFAHAPRAAPPPGRESLPAGQGRALPANLRAEFGARMGQDFSGVRLHDGAGADEAARAQEAKAFTLGDDVVLSQDVAPLDTQGGRQTIAHELAHVVQQRRGGPPPAMATDAAHEQGADRAASAAVSGGGAIAVSGGTGVGVARQPMDPRHARGYSGEQGMGFELYPSSDGWVFVEGPSGAAGHNATAPGFDGVAYNTRTGELHIIDNKSFKRGGNVHSASAITKNLGKNLNDLIARVSSMSKKQFPACDKVLAQLKGTRDALAKGQTIPARTKLIVTNAGGRSTGVSQRLKNLGVEFRDANQPQPKPPAGKQSKASGTPGSASSPKAQSPKAAGKAAAAPKPPQGKSTTAKSTTGKNVAPTSKASKGPASTTVAPKGAPTKGVKPKGGTPAKKAAPSKGAGAKGGASKPAPKAAPKATPKASAKGSSKPAPKGVAKGGAKVSATPAPKATSKGAPKALPNASAKSAPKASPKASPKAAPKAPPKAASASKGGSPAVAPKAAPPKGGAIEPIVPKGAPAKPMAVPKGGGAKPMVTPKGGAPEPGMPMPKGGGGKPSVGGGIASVALPIVAGLIHNKAVEKRVEKQASEEGFVPHNAPSGEGLAYDLGAWLIDPMRDAEKAVDAVKRFKVSPWRQKVRDKANATPAGETFDFTWEDPQCTTDLFGNPDVKYEYRKVTYKKGADGRLTVESGDASGAVDLNDVIDDRISDEEIDRRIPRITCGGGGGLA